MRLENAIFSALDEWLQKIKESYMKMIRPLLDALVKHDQAIAASELKTFINCNTCTEIVQFINRPPNDELLIQALAMT